MLSLLAASTAAADPIYWSDLGLRSYLFEIGGFQLRYYSLAYLIGVVFAYWHLTKMIRQSGAPMAQRHADDLFFYCTLGVILGGRLGYAIFYNPDMWANPIQVLKLWEGGMSFHGGLIGVLLAIAWVSRRGGVSFLRVCDFVAVNVPLGYMLGRLANFVNGELWGRATDVSWGMVFPTGGEIVRHPSQLYQAGFEGLLMFIVMMVLFWKTRARFRPGLMVGIFTTGMGIGRFVNEFFREPDAQLADFAVQTGLSMGQWLTIPLILTGLIVTAFAVMRKPVGAGTGSPVAA